MAKLITSEDPFGQGALWTAVLEIYQSFSRICEELHLRHYVIGGTLLGAVRHRGFIPWDDDFDVAMPRADYEAFKVHMISGCGMPGLAYVDKDNCKAFETQYCKLINTNQDYVGKLEKDLGFRLPNGVFIDIFPIDGHPGSRLNTLLATFVDSVNFSRYNFGMGWRVCRSHMRTVISYVAGVFFSFFLRPLHNKREYLEARRRNLMRYRFSDGGWSGMAGVIGTRYQMVFKPGVFGEGVMLPFEGIKVCAPRCYGYFLRVNYGYEYMQLPPPEKQFPVHAKGENRPWRFGPTDYEESVK